MDSIVQWDSILGMDPAASIAPSGQSDLKEAAMA